MPITQVIGPKKRPDGTHLPLSGAVQAGDFLFLSGQLAMNAEGQIEGNDIETQTAKVLDNIEDSLAAAGYGKANIVKATVWLISTDDFIGFNRAYAEFFGELPPPTRSTVCSALMAQDAQVEIEVLAYVGA